jgi:CMP-N,N'-diacetyllegionaminic acid synthase
MNCSKRGPIISVILARGGSKGVPGKNVASVGGRPCVAWTIDASRQASCVHETVVSSDDPRVHAVAQSMGATSIDRPTALAGDSARVDDAVRHAVHEYERFGVKVGGVVILYGNVPVRPEGLIDRALVVFLEGDCDSVQSYAPVGKHHPWWTARIGPDHEVQAWDDGAVLNHGVHRRQDLPPAYVPDGGVLVVSREALMGEIPGVPDGPHAFFGAVRRGVVNPEGSVVDIDAPIDLIVADAILSSRLHTLAA